MTGDAVLAIDIGGSKMLAALVDGATVVEERTLATPRHETATAWCDALAGLVADWGGRYRAAGAAVTGQVAAGRWHALNPDILPVPAGFPLVAELEARLKVKVAAVNDAHAAAWGEYRFGAGRGADIVFLTISTGIGGGAVSGGRLLTGAHGLAGHVGQTRPDGDARVEDLAGGAFMAEAARAAGHPTDARGVFAAAKAGLAWAEAILGRSAEIVARLLRDLQMLFDPNCFVVGGGIGLADGYLDRVRAALERLPGALRPEVRPAALGIHAGVIGVADLARRSLTTEGE